MEIIKKVNFGTVHTSMKLGTYMPYNGTTMLRRQKKRMQLTTRIIVLYRYEYYKGNRGRYIPGTNSAVLFSIPPCGRPFGLVLDTTTQIYTVFAERPQHQVQYAEVA